MKARRWVTWLIFAICGALLLNALGWVTWHALRLERAERDARAEAQFQELIRLALWRMEGEVTPLLAQEGARPYFHYYPFYPAERAYTRMWQDVGPNEVLVPSPLLEGGGSYVKLYFQIEADGRVTSPQVPIGEMRERAESSYLDREFLVLASERLGELRSITAGGFPFAVRVPTAPAPEVESEQFSQVPQKRTAQEFAARQQAAQSANVLNLQRMRKGGEADAKTGWSEQASAAEPARDGDAFGRRGAPSSEVRQGPLAARWIRNPRTGEEELVLHRRVEFAGTSVLQGLWIDWPLLRARLRAATADLLPEADLAPAGAQVLGRSPASHLMASIPVLLAPGKAPVLTELPTTPTRISLGFTWLAVLTAVGAIGVVLRKSMELSDRRGRFVSAVTHELRTPLTTFCLYTEMLAEGMVRDEDARRGYLTTLKGESRRLAGIVENVLEYARLGGKKPPAAGPPIMARDLIARIQPALERCADRCDMRLVVEGAPDPSLRVTADLQTVERILLNLIDNACKYAGDAPDRRVHLVVGSFGRGGRAYLELRVRDHGPGIPPQDAKRIFKAFQRGRRDAQSSKAGLGLGLALSRALARELGGDLILATAGQSGAEFVLLLPA